MDGQPLAAAGLQAGRAAAIHTPAIQQLIDDLIDTMREYDGAGLAEPQVHVPQRVVVFEVHNNPRYPAAPNFPLTVLINAQIMPISEAQDLFWEGCLSIPDLRGSVPRYTHVRLGALDRHGAPSSWELQGFAAAVVQHECDHLDGVLYIDRVPDPKHSSFLREFKRFHWDKGVAPRVQAE